MGRVIILLCALFCLITIIIAAPNCNDVATKYMEDCTAQLNRWTDLQNQFRLLECPTQQPGDVDYDRCIHKANRSATYQLIFELPEEARNMFIAAFGGGGLSARDIIINGLPAIMKFLKDSKWLQSSLNEETA